MSGQNLFERILGSLHLAVLDDSRWPAASGLIHRAIGAKGSFLTTGEGASLDDLDVFFAQFCYGEKRYTELEREYFEVYQHVDERVPRIPMLTDSHVVPATSLFTEDEKKTSPVYNEALPRTEALDGLLARLDGPRGTSLAWAIADPVDRDGWTGARLDTIERLLPQLRQFARVRQALIDAGALGATYAELLENTRTGVIQLDRRARVLEANDSARHILRSSLGLSYQDGLLKAADPAEQAVLQSLLAQALPASGATGSGGSMTLSGRRSSPRLVLHATPVGAASVHARRTRIRALVLLHEPSPRPRIGPARVGAVLGLTKPESELAVWLARGETIPEIAAATGRNENTLRWQLKQIFSKHGLSRQIELVRLVASLDAFPGPKR